jgi:ribosomal protein S18 acetylase RimI-like enzyme
MHAHRTPPPLTVHHTTDAGAYLDQAGDFLRRRPVEHSVLLSVATSRLGERPGDGPEPNLWLWVEQAGDVVAAAQHTPPHGAYLSTGPVAAMHLMARALRELRPALPGVGGIAEAPREFAAEWGRLGGGPAGTAMGEALYAADAVTIPSGVAGRLRQATHGDAPLLRVWCDEFVAEAGVTAAPGDAIGRRIDAGTLFVWEVDGAVVSMAATTPPQAGVSRIQLVYTPPEQRKRGYASACVASLTAHELAQPGRTCMLYADLANPTSNGIYQAIGYRRVGDAVDLKFAEPRVDGAHPSSKA